MKTKKILIDDYVQSLSLYNSLSLKNRRIKIISIMSSTHKSEKLFDNEYIYPRGIDFIQSVSIEASKQYQYLNISSIKDKQHIFNLLNFKWTQSWIVKIEKWYDIKYQFHFNQDISFSSFAEMYYKSERALQVFIDRNKDLKKYIYKKNGIKFITIDGANFIKDNFFIKEEIKRMSEFIANNLSGLHQEYDFIELIKENKIRNNTIRSIKEKTYNAELIVKESLGLKYYDFLAMIKRNHPHENLMISVKKDNKKYQHGDKNLTANGISWYQEIYLKYRSDDEVFIEKDIHWSLELLNANDYPAYEYIDTSFDELAIINNMSLEQIGTTLNIFLSDYFFIKNDKSYLNKEGLMILENDFPIFKLRHLSYQLSKCELITLEYITPATKKSEWLEVDDLSDTKIYKGVIMSNFSTQGIDSFTKIIVVNIKQENGEDIKLRIPYILLQDRKIYQLLLAHVPIVFEIEKVNAFHNRIKWFRLYSKIMYTLNWNNYKDKYVVASSVGRKSKKEKKEVKDNE